MGKLSLNISNKRNISSDCLGKEQGEETSDTEVLMRKPTAVFIIVEEQEESQCGWHRGSAMQSVGR